MDIPKLNFQGMKTFANFEVLWLFTKIFFVTFWDVASFGGTSSKQSTKKVFFPWQSYFLPIREIFFSVTILFATNSRKFLFRDNLICHQFAEVFFPWQSYFPPIREIFFFRDNLICHQFAKVLSHKSFPLYGSYLPCWETLVMILIYVKVPFCCCSSYLCIGLLWV